MSERRTAVRSVLVYSLAITLVSGSNFLAVPMLLGLLGHDEFARWALLEPILLAALPVAGLGIQIGLLRYAQADLRNGEVTSNLLPFHGTASLCIGALATGLALGFGFSLSASALLGMIIFAEGALVFLIALWRAQDRPVLYAAVEGGRAATITLALAAALLVLGGASSDTEDYLLLRLCTALLALALAASIVRPRFKPNYRASSEAALYGAPIVVASMLAALLVSIDRYALSQTDSSAISSYVAHARVAQVLSVAVGAFYTWFAPKAIQSLSGGTGAHPFLVNSTSAFVFMLVGICANIWLAAPLAWLWVFPSVPLDRHLFGILLIGTAIFSLGNPLSLAALRPGKTHHALFIVLAALAVGAGASFALAGPFGTLGVAFGRVLGLLTYSMAFAVNTVAVLRIQYPWGSYVGVTAGAVLGCTLLEQLVVVTDVAGLLATLTLFNLSFFGFNFVAFVRQSRRTSADIR